MIRINDHFFRFGIDLIDDRYPFVFVFVKIHRGNALRRILTCRDIGFIVRKSQFDISVQLMQIS